MAKAAVVIFAELETHGEAARVLNALQVVREFKEAGGLLASGTVTEFVGVDLDETAIIEARARWPGAKFICADAARLGPEYTRRFDTVLIRRPDLLAQPGRWRQVFKRLPTLLQAEGRVLLTLFGEA